MRQEAGNRAFIISRMARRYPVLADVFRKKMRAILYKHGHCTKESLFQAAKIKAMDDQIKEGITDPVSQESNERWQSRLNEHKRQLTDFLFAEHYSINDANSIIEDIKFMNLQLVEMIDSEDTSFELLKNVESLKERKNDETEDPELNLIKVNMIRNFISEQLDFITIAKQYFTFNDLQEIKARIIGTGRIGGKAAGMLLAHSILKHKAKTDNDIPEVSLPACYFLGSDIFTQFFNHNNALFFRVQKYKPVDVIEKEYDIVKKKIMGYDFPFEYMIKFRNLLNKFNKQPLIVRSSSLLEDNVQTSFAGKYESIFITNNGTPEENLLEFVNAIKKVYSSVFSANAMAYRKEKNLIDYDEKMAVLIQKVVGTGKGKYYMPFAAGVGFSLNMFRWNNKIEPEDGMLRTVLGLGTRAVDRVGKDYPRIVALTDPMLRPEKKTIEIRKYSQKFVDVLNLQSKQIEHVPFKEIAELLSADELQMAAVIDKGGYFSNNLISMTKNDRFVLTLDGLMKHPMFTKNYKKLLTIIKENYGIHVDTEFAITYDDEKRKIKIYLLQCRPLARKEDSQSIEIPIVRSRKKLLFRSKGISPCGKAENVKYIVCVDPDAYYQISDENERFMVSKIVGSLNNILPEKQFILLGPGRWGTSDNKLGVKVGYGEINNTSVLIELATGSGFSSDASYGTHFFLDLVEAEIFPLSINITENSNYFNFEFIRESENLLKDFLPNYKEFGYLVKVVDVEKEKPGEHLNVYMSLREGKSIAVFEPEKKGRLV